MDAAPPPDDPPRPTDVPTLQGMVRDLTARNRFLERRVVELETQVVTLEAKVAELDGQLDALLKHRFGRRSERRTPTPRPPGPPPRRDEHGRSPLPPHLERRDTTHDLTDAQKPCPRCGTLRPCIGEQVTEQLDLEPVTFFVRRTIKRTYACRSCDPAAVPADERIATAGPSQVGPIAKGLCGPGLLAHAVTAKFADHTPIHRLAGQLARSGVTVARSTLTDWLGGAADLLTPLCQLMTERLLLSRVVHADDTPVKLRVPKATKAKASHLWVAVGDADFPYVAFDFTADHSAAGPTAFFQGFQGFLQADALAQYETLFGAGKATHVCCVAHARRKFVAAADGGDGRANAAVELFGRLYAIERGLPPLLPPSDDPAERTARRAREAERQRLRQRDADPILAELKAWLDAMRPSALPKSALGTAIGYALNNWAALTRYRDEGYLAIDNNLAERTLRAVALGRNNWGVFGSESGGRTAATLYSVVGTCKHLGIDPFAYLRDTLPGLFALGEKPTAEQLLDWLPDRWLLRTRENTSRPASAA
ncbi:MAG: IS66 family transposase [Planctomycetaceae bacterium]|nr:IS66 family transposase [Planctomycetaceae bacterium]